MARRNQISGYNKEIDDRARYNLVVLMTLGAGIAVLSWLYYQAFMDWFIN